jgi:hypothetical protein
MRLIQILNRMNIQKRYGQSKVLKCPFCNNTATTESSQGLPVCSNHKKNELPDIRCACGSWLEIKKGKWGAYFNCINCGNINLKKGLELSSNTKQKTDKSKATTIKSDDIGIIY